MKPPRSRIVISDNSWICVDISWTSCCSGEAKDIGKEKWRESKKGVCLFSTTSLPLLYKRWSTLQKIYYIQAEILSSAGAIHHPGHETLWMIPPNYVDQPCLRRRFNFVTLVTPGILTPHPLASHNINLANSYTKACKLKQSVSTKMHLTHEQTRWMWGEYTGGIEVVDPLATDQLQMVIRGFCGLVKAMTNKTIPFNGIL